MGSLFSKPKVSTPTIVYDTTEDTAAEELEVEETAVMPDVDEAEQAKIEKRLAAQQAQRSGRSSTMLTEDSGTLG